jgi:hypothetical protein
MKAEEYQAVLCLGGHTCRCRFIRESSLSSAGSEGGMLTPRRAGSQRGPDVLVELFKAQKGTGREPRQRSKRPLP